MRHPLQSSLFNLHYFYSRDVALGDFQPHFLRVTFDFIKFSVIASTTFISKYD